MNMKEILEKFIKWAKVKFKIHSSDEIRFYFKERDIWWASLGINVGLEQDGKNERFERPVLVLKKFNKNMLWILPMTSKNKKGKYFHSIEYKNKKYAVILSQLRLISSKRLTRKIRRLSKSEFDEIRAKIKAFL